MSVLCATDFSPCSRTAARLAASVARRRGEGLILLHALEPLPLDPGMALVDTSGWQGEMMSAAQAEIARQAAELAREGVAVETRVVFGLTARLVLEAARTVETSLIVVGTHGRKSMARLFLGSSAEEVVRSAPCPVLVTGERGADFARWEGQAPLRLAVATDGSRATESLFRWARASVPAIAEQISLVRMYWPPQEASRYGIEAPWLGNEGHPDLLELIERDLRHDSAALAGSQPPAIHFRVTVRDAGEELAENAAALGVDALAISVPQHRIGSWASIVPETVLRSATLPVFCIPEKAEPGKRSIPQYRSVLIASDLSSLAAEAILPAYGLLTGGGRAELCFVHELGRLDAAGEPPHPPSLSEEQRRAIEDQLRASIPPAGADRGIGTQVCVLQGQLAADTIVQAAERMDVDVIALASHGRSGLGHLFFGSVAEEVARKSSRPVLIVHAK